MVGAHYLSDDYNIDYVVHGQVLLACAKSHLSTLENEPKDFIKDESGTVIGVVSTYWDFVLSGIVGKSPGIKIQDNYWYICKDTGVPEEEQVWENTGVKAKMELSDLTPEEIEILQRPGKEVVTEFVNNTMTQSTGQDSTKIMSQKATTDALNTKASTSALSAAVENEVLRANNAYQPKGDYATNTRVDGLQEELNTFKGETADNFDSVESSLETLQDNIDSVAESIPTKVSELENDSNYQTKTNVETLLEPIKAVIPSGATALNQLADKAFVNSSIATSTANFRGTSAAGLTEAQFLTWANSLTHDENDYIYWNTVDSVGNVVFKRYKYSGNSWVYEYDLNNSSFTADEWAAIQSGINSTLVTKLSDLPTNADLTTTLNSKVDKVAGKQLSTEDYTTAEKNKLAGIASGAQVNVLEGVKVDGTELPITDKKVDIDLSGKVDVALHQSQEDQSFVFRQTGGGNLTIDAKNAELTSIKGRTLAWNVRTNNSSVPSSLNGFTYSAGTHNSIIMNGSGITSRNGWLGLSENSFIQGHKYYVRVYEFGGTGTLDYNFNSINIVVGTGYIIQINSVTSSSRFEFVANGTVSNKEFTCLCVDITLLYGTEIDGMTDAEILAKYEADFGTGYHEYNAGTLISNDAQALETVGFNQWDEEWLRGYYNAAGQYVEADNRICSKNRIKVFGDTDYYIKSPNAMTFFFFDENFNNLGNAISRFNAIFHTPSSCSYILFYASLTDYGNTYNHDICINLSDSDKNGTYEPYWKKNLPLSLGNFKVKSPNVWDEEWELGQLDGNGVPSSSQNNIRSKNYIKIESGNTYYGRKGGATYLFACWYDTNKTYISNSNISDTTAVAPNNATYCRIYTSGSTGYGPTYNNDICINKSDVAFNGRYFPYGTLEFEGGLKSAGSIYDEIDSVRNKYVKRVGEVDLGTLSYSVNNNVFRSPISDIKKSASTSSIANIISPLYTATTPIVVNSKDKTMASDETENKIAIKDTAYTDAATFKTAMSGVMLYYELATPIEYELVEPICTDYPVDKLGTERIISDTVPTPPFNADIRYHEANIKDIEIEGITEYLKREELTDELDKLDTIEEGAQENKIEHITLDGTEQTISNKTVNLPAYPTTLPASDVSA